jgi:hypothetical protein
MAFSGISLHDLENKVELGSYTGNGLSGCSGPLRRKNQTLNRGNGEVAMSPRHDDAAAACSAVTGEVRSRTLGYSFVTWLKHT